MSSFSTVKEDFISLISFPLLWLEITEARKRLLFLFLASVQNSEACCRPKTPIQLVNPLPSLSFHTLPGSQHPLWSS